LLIQKNTLKQPKVPKTRRVGLKPIGFKEIDFTESCRIGRVFFYSAQFNPG